MSINVFSPMSQRRVLEEVDSKCGYEGNKITYLSIPDMSSEEISTSCHLLSELGFIETESWDDKRGRVYFPIRITPDGKKYLSESNKTFWDLAEKIAVDAVKEWTGVKFDVGAMIDFFKITIQKYKQERQHND